MVLKIALEPLRGYEGGMVRCTATHVVSDETAPCVCGWGRTRGTGELGWNTFAVEVKAVPARKRRKAWQAPYPGGRR